jgi:flagellar motor protein MotB
MLSSRITVRRGGRDEGEKPFWISYADMMTAMMVLFLVVMCAALLVPRAERDDQIDGIMDEVARTAVKYPGVHVHREQHVIDFGDRARFDTGSSTLSADQERLLRSFAPEVLRIAADPRGKRWLKHVVVEGYTDRRGAYLYNLNLSLQRSQRVLCALLSPPLAGEPAMSPQQLRDVRQLFLVGGYSSNSAKATLEASRRIELRLEFYGVGEGPEPAQPAYDPGIGVCAL